MGTTTNPGTGSEVLASMGASGERLHSIDVVEAGGGDIPCVISWDVDLSQYFDTSLTDAFAVQATLY